MKSKYSIAVLPFVNLSADREYDLYSEGLTLEIIYALGKAEGLHILAGNSSFQFRERVIDIREIGKKLNVSLILEGSIRQIDSIFRVSVQLIQAESGFHWWTESWELEVNNLFQQLERMGKEIAGKINSNSRYSFSAGSDVKLTGNQLHLYLKARALLNRDDEDSKFKAIRYFEKVLEDNFSFPGAWEGIMDGYRSLQSSGSVSPQEADKQVRLGISASSSKKTSPLILNELAQISCWNDWDLQQAVKYNTESLKRLPSNPDALINRGSYLAALGAVYEAFDALYRAGRLLPLSRKMDQINYAFSTLYYYIGDLDRSLEFLDESFRNTPGNAEEHSVLKCKILCRQKLYRKAEAILHELHAKGIPGYRTGELYGYYYACRGNREKAAEQVESLGEQIHTGDPSLRFLVSSLSEILLLSGEKERAMDYLELGIRWKVASFLFVGINSLWNDLRDHSRYTNILEQMPGWDGREDTLPEKETGKKSKLSMTQALNIEMDLNAHIHMNEPFLDPFLSLTDLAESIDIAPELLSQVFNELLGLNIYDYLNTFRLEHFLKLTDGDQLTSDKIEKLAYDAGFCSLALFRRFFKDTIGTSPLEYFQPS